MECTSELDINSSIFLTTDNNDDNMYCECSGRMFNFLNNSQHDTLLPEFIIILIALFRNLKICRASYPRKLYIHYDGMHIRKINCSQVLHRDNRSQRSNYVAC